MSNDRYLATAALYYANGPLHMGHMVELIEADLWVRSQRLLGKSCLFVSGVDAHGTPVMLKAEQEGLTPSELVEKNRLLHLQAIEAFGIELDNYSSTDTAVNKKYCYNIYEALKSDNALFEKECLQAFDEEKQMFLPDRFVKGTCPRCQAPDQYGDNCERCGATYTPSELLDPYSALTKTKPSFKTSRHLFLNLEQYRDWLQDLLPHIVQDNVLAKLNEWFKDELRPWNITRDEPYYGFRVPDRDKQYFYVWFDAPIGYLASFNEAIEKANLPDQPLAAESPWQMVHFIGKDISYFHSLFWPVLLKASQQKIPSKIFVHGFLTVDGQKMSKSKGTFIEALHLAKAIDPDLFRYYLASKMQGSIDDLNLDFKEFVEKINSDLVGKFVNILSRCSKLLFDYRQGEFHPTGELPHFAANLERSQQILKLFTERSSAQALSLLMKAAAELNEVLTQAQPWRTLADAAQADEGWRVITDVLMSFKVLAYTIQPVMPRFAKKLLSYFTYTSSSDLGQRDKALTQSYEPILYRLEEQQIKEKLFMNDISKPEVVEQPKAPELKPLISIDDFAKVDLRIGVIKTAEPVVEADKLLRLEVDLGFKTIQVFSGIKKFVDPQQIIGKQVVVCVNLQPRKMKFGLSEGMLLAASDDQGLCLLSPQEQRVLGATIS